MKRLWLPTLAIIFSFLGCDSKPTNQQQLAELQAEMIEVEVLEFANRIKVGEPTIIRLKITDGYSMVIDADDVRFELWKEGEDKDMYEANHDGNGVYRAEVLFDKPGRYRLMYHVTARSQHVMEQMLVIVEEADTLESLSE